MACVWHELEVVVERGSYLENRVERRVPASVRQQAANDLGLDRDPSRDLRLGEAAARSGALERPDEGVSRGDLGTSDLELLAERGVAKLLVEELVEARLARHWS